MRRRLGLFVKLALLLLLFGIFYSYAMFQGGFVSWFLFYSFLPLLVYMLLLLVYPLSNWSVKRKLSKKIIQAGDKIVVEIEAQRKFPFPIYYCIVEEFFPSSLQKKDVGREKYRYIDQLDATMENRKVKEGSFPWFKRTLHYTYTLENIPRGQHHFHAIRIRTGDFLGFIKKDHIFEVDSKLLVYPTKRNVIVTERVNSFDEGASPSYTVNLKNTNMVTGVREYIPGDRFSWIDWKTTARKNKVMTKEFEQEKSTSVLLVLDTIDSSELNPLTFEACVELIYSFTESYSRRQSSLALLSLGKESIYFSDQDQAKKAEMKNFLATVRPSGDTPFSQQLVQEANRASQGVIVMLVTTYLNYQMKQSIDQLKKKSKRIILTIIKPRSKLSEQDEKVIQQLRVEGVIVNLLTEKQLLNNEFEVNM